MSDFKEIFDLIRRERVVVVIGAGFSLKAGMPSCPKVCDAIRAALPEEIRNSVEDMRDFLGNDLQQLSNDFIDVWGDTGRYRLIQSIKPLFDIAPDANLSDHVALSKIPHLSKIHTTNYDTLLEYVFKDECYVIKQDKDFRDIPKGRTIILKPHGDFETPDSIILSRSDYDGWFKGERLEMLWQELERDAVSKSILFMGYSFTDSNFQYLLKRIKEKLNGSTHQHYLVAPDWQSSKVRRLQPYHIKYYNGTGEIFFNELTEYLKKYIIRDCAKKITSPETCERFNRAHHNTTEITVRPDNDNIIRVKSLNGAHEQMKFTVIGDKVHLINESRMTELVKSPITGLLLPTITLKADKGEFTDCSFTLNGVELSTSDIAQIQIQPSTTEGVCHIKIPALHFNERLKYISYTVHKQCIVHCIDSELYLLKIETTYNEGTNMFSSTFTFEFKKEFSSLGRARTLMKLPVAVQSGLKFSITDLKAPSAIDMPSRKPDDPNNWSNAPIQCYLSLLEIIEDCGGKFNSYPCFSLENLECAMYLVAYLKKVSVPFVDHKPLNIKFSVVDSEYENKPDMIVGQDYGFCETTSENRIEFAGNEWHIPTRITWYSKCTILKNIVDDEGKRHIEMCDNGYAGGFYLGENKKQKLLPNKRQLKTVALIQDAMRFIGKFPFL